MTVPIWRFHIPIHERYHVCKKNLHRSRMVTRCAIAVLPTTIIAIVFTGAYGASESQPGERRSPNIVVHRRGTTELVATLYVFCMWSRGRIVQLPAGMWEIPTSQWPDAGTTQVIKGDGDTSYRGQILANTTVWPHPNPNSLTHPCAFVHRSVPDITRVGSDRTSQFRPGAELQMQNLRADYCTYDSRTKSAHAPTGPRRYYMLSKCDQKRWSVSATGWEDREAETPTRQKKLKAARLPDLTSQPRRASGRCWGELPPAGRTAPRILMLKFMETCGRDSGFGSSRFQRETCLQHIVILRREVSKARMVHEILGRPRTTRHKTTLQEKNMAVLKYWVVLALKDVNLLHSHHPTGAAVTERLACSPSTKTSRVQSSASQRVSSVISRFPRPCIPALLRTYLTLIGSQDPDCNTFRYRTVADANFYQITPEFTGYVWSYFPNSSSCLSTATFLPEIRPMSPAGHSTLPDGRHSKARNHA
ncbi:hypothetical protein PR048_006864 [Dryococelus australis]|uniref:Uncharacterized protein n=1 Tax=Dryococelus australis TaxID=614101 RepID=A0ABQ9IC36_9NEOP|nr:hypothetical protein PR048_006864 [Dryococelus australis]